LYIVFFPFVPSPFLLVYHLFTNFHTGTIFGGKVTAGADGVHVGQSDLPVKTARRLIGDGILGVSVSNAKEAARAAEDGADYIGVGAMYATDTKTDATPVCMEELKRIREAVKIPIVVIGGINQKTAANFYGSGADGLAAVSGVIAQRDIAKAASELIRLFLCGPGAAAGSL
jgi:thiamine-phosphate pyrophosphorylase